MTREEERRAARRYAITQDLRIQADLVKANQGFVHQCAYAFSNYGLDHDDLVQEGNLGLLKAIDKFDPDRGFRLISYAVSWIRVYMMNFIVKNWSLVKIGTTQAQRKLFFSLSKAQSRLRLEDGSAASDELLAAELKVKPAEVAEMRQRLDHDLSLDTTVPGNDEGTLTFKDILELEAAGQDDLLISARSSARGHRLVRTALSQLGPRERYIIEQHVMSDEPQSLTELGDHFGVSRERARQLELRAMKKMRKFLVPKESL